jgi:hypothetical protein
VTECTVALSGAQQGGSFSPAKCDLFILLSRASGRFSLPVCTIRLELSFHFAWTTKFHSI